MDGWMAIKALAALLVVLGLIGLMSLALRRIPGGWAMARAEKGGQGILRILETRRLGMRHQLVRVAYGEEEHLLLLGPHGDLAVGRRARPPATDRKETDS